MQTQAVYYEHKINDFVWLIIQDQYSAEHKWILNFVLIQRFVHLLLYMSQEIDFEAGI